MQSHHSRWSPLLNVAAIFSTAGPAVVFEQLRDWRYVKSAAASALVALVGWALWRWL